MPRVAKQDLNELIFRVDDSIQQKWKTAVEDFSISTKRNIRSDCNLLAKFYGTKDFSAITIDVIARWADHMIETEGSALESVLRRLRSIQKVVKIIGGIDRGELENLYRQTELRPCKTHKEIKHQKSFPIANIDEVKISEPEYCRNAAIAMLVNEGMKTEEISVLKRSDMKSKTSKFYQFLAANISVKNLLEKWFGIYGNLDDDYPLFFPFTPRGYRPVKKVLHYSSVWKIKCKYNEESSQGQSDQR